VTTFYYSSIYRNPLLLAIVSIGSIVSLYLSFEKSSVGKNDK
jgi:hypothetical protein